jgi:hypothetical protein
MSLHKAVQDCGLKFLVFRGVFCAGRMESGTIKLGDQFQGFYNGQVNESVLWIPGSGFQSDPELIFWNKIRIQDNIGIARRCSFKHVLLHFLAIKDYVILRKTAVKMASDVKSLFFKAFLGEHKW